MTKILAIDDMMADLISLKTFLQDAFPEATLYTETDGHKGIEMAIAKDPDVILLDILMPKIDGFEICRQLKEDKRVKDIPVIFITGINADKNIRIKALEVGAEAFVSKPIDVSELTAQIKAMVKIKHANQQKSDEKDRLATLVFERTRELEESQIHFKNLADSGQALIWTANLDKKCDYFNQPWLDFTGRTFEQEKNYG
ncbi:MAG: response regulator, partial [Bacteroidales bacterium]|nr:response regulator [Bacteroidales bacterium]